MFLYFFKYLKCYSDFFFFFVTIQQLTLYTKHACKVKIEDITTTSGLSTGSIYIIIFLIVIFAYLSLGMVVNYFLIGARGIEIIPHLSFWRDFPALVKVHLLDFVIFNHNLIYLFFYLKDGATFLQNGCKVVPSDLTQNQDSYDSI